MSYPTRPELPDNPPSNSRCAACGEQLVPGQSKSVEVQDYVLYFCGLDCYHRWRHEHGDSNPT